MYILLKKSLDGIQVKTQNVGDCTNIKIKITILDKKTKQNLRQKEISVSDFENDKFATIKFKKIQIVKMNVAVAYRRNWCRLWKWSDLLSGKWKFDWKIDF